MSISGYERSFYNDVARAADSLQDIAQSLEAIRWELRQQRELKKATLANTIDALTEVLP